MKKLSEETAAKGGKNGRDTQLGLAPEDAEPEFKAKATEVVAKKAGVSTRTFERGKKILEEASEDDKQKLREGKASITRVYSEIVSGENAQTKKDSTEPMVSRMDLVRFRIKQSCWSF